MFYFQLLLLSWRCSLARRVSCDIVHLVLVLKQAPWANSHNYLLRLFGCMSYVLGEITIFAPKPFILIIEGQSLLIQTFIMITQQWHSVCYIRKKAKKEINVAVNDWNVYIKRNTQTHYQNSMGCCHVMLWKSLITIYKTNRVWCLKYSIMCWSTGTNQLSIHVGINNKSVSMLGTQSIYLKIF